MPVETPWTLTRNDILHYGLDLSNGLHNRVQISPEKKSENSADETNNLTVNQQKLRSRSRLER